MKDECVTTTYNIVELNNSCKSEDLYYSYNVHCSAFLSRGIFFFPCAILPACNNGYSETDL